MVSKLSEALATNPNILGIPVLGKHIHLSGLVFQNSYFLHNFSFPAYLSYKKDPPHTPPPFQFMYGDVVIYI